MRVYLTVSAEDYPAASQAGRHFAHMAYRIGENSALLRQNLPLQTRGGLLCATDRGAPAVQNPAALCAAVLRECGRRGYTGAVLDFEEAPRQDLKTFAAALSRRMRETGRKLYLPLPYAKEAPEATALVCTAVSGGNYREYLEETVQRWGGPDRIALDVQRLRMDFCLPAPSGEGVPLDAAAFAEWSLGKAVYFSPDLCARYFTCTRQGQAHFVLFDDADTLARKLKTGTELGIETAFFQWPEVRDLAGSLPLG